MDTITLQGGTYWRLRFLQADLEAQETRLRLARAGLDLAMREAGVPAVGEYRWDDNSTSLVPLAGAQEAK